MRVQKSIYFICVILIFLGSCTNNINGRYVTYKIETQNSLIPDGNIYNSFKSDSLSEVLKTKLLNKEYILSFQKEFVSIKSVSPDGVNINLAKSTLKSDPPIYELAEKDNGTQIKYFVTKTDQAVLLSVTVIVPYNENRLQPGADITLPSYKYAHAVCYLNKLTND